MRSGVRASHTSSTTSSRTLNTHIARGVGTVVHVRVDPRVKLVREVGVVVSGIARTGHATRVGAVVSVRIETGVHLVAHVGCVRASVCGSRGCAAVVHVRVVAGIELVGHVGVMSAIVGGSGCGVLVLGSGTRGGIVAYAVAGLFS
jgi:hypothetical protein